MVTSVDDGQWTVALDSDLPWEGQVRITVTPEQTTEFTLHLRIPSWAASVSVRINSEPQPLPSRSLPVTHSSATASGYDPRLARFIPLRGAWSPGDVVELEFEMPIIFRRASPKVHGQRGKVAVTRGPLVYCLESVDNPDVDIFTARLDVGHALSVTYIPTLLGGTQIIRARTTDGKPLILIPYFLWANRGESQMTVWVNSSW